MKTRDRLAVEVMHAIIKANPYLVTDASRVFGQDVKAALEIFEEARGQIRDKWLPGYFPDDNGDY